MNNEKETLELVLLREAAEQNIAVAQEELGFMYYHGKGVPQSYSESFKWFLKAGKEPENEWAPHIIGFMYAKGYGVEKSDGEALKWFINSTKNNEPWFPRPSDCPSTEYDFSYSSEDFMHCRQLAEQGDEIYQYLLGDMYLRGQGVEQSCAQAFKLFLKCAEQGDAEAQCRIGWFYAHGEGVEQSDSQSFLWYRQAAEQGDDGAQHILGFMYAKGYGVEQNDSEALKWFIKGTEDTLYEWLPE